MDNRLERWKTAGIALKNIADQRRETELKLEEKIQKDVWDLEVWFTSNSFKAARGILTYRKLYLIDEDNYKVWIDSGGVKVQDDTGAHNYGFKSQPSSMLEDPFDKAIKKWGKANCQGIIGNIEEKLDSIASGVNGGGWPISQ